MPGKESAPEEEELADKWRRWFESASRRSVSTFSCAHQIDPRYAREISVSHTGYARESDSKSLCESDSESLCKSDRICQRDESHTLS